MDGNVGIGMASPAYELDASGTIRGSRTSLGVGVIGDVTDGTGVAGNATGSPGTGVYGEASNTGAVTNYGGYFQARGSTGRGVYGRALYTGSVQDKNTNYGGYFQSDGMKELACTAERPHLPIIVEIMENIFRQMAPLVLACMVKPRESMALA